MQLCPAVEGAGTAVYLGGEGWNDTTPALTQAAGPLEAQPSAWEVERGESRPSGQEPTLASACFSVAAVQICTAAGAATAEAAAIKWGEPSL